MKFIIAVSNTTKIMNNVNNNVVFDMYNRWFLLSPSKNIIESFSGCFALEGSIQVKWLVCLQYMGEWVMMKVSSSGSGLLLWLLEE